jgi:hypothetical protein
VRVSERLPSSCLVANNGARVESRMANDDVHDVSTKGSMSGLRIIGRRVGLLELL